MNTAVWLRIPLLPLEFHDEEGMETIAKELGKLLKIDNNTVEVKRGSYASLCVEIDLSKPLVLSIVKGKYDYHIEYEHVHLICFACGRAGRRKEECSSNLAPEKVNSGDNSNIDVSGPFDAKHVRFNELMKDDSIEEIGFGEWMVVSRRKKPQPSKLGPANSQAQKLNTSKPKTGATKNQNSPSPKDQGKANPEDKAGPGNNNGNNTRNKPTSAKSPTQAQSSN